MTASRKPKIALVIFILLCVIGAAGFAAYSFFRVHSVEVNGNEQVTKERIVALSGIILDESMFRLDLEAIESSVRREPYIDVLAVKRILPHSVEIDVRERTAVAEVVFGGKMVIIDELGVVLEIEQQRKTQYIEVTGIDLKGYKLAEPIATEDDFQGTSLISLILALKESEMLGEIESIDISNPLNLMLRLHNGLTIRMGQPDALLDKLAWVKQVAPKLEELGLLDGVLDVTSAVDAKYEPKREEEEITDEGLEDGEDGVDPEGGSEGSDPDEGDEDAQPEPESDESEPDELGSPEPLEG